MLNREVCERCFPRAQAEIDHAAYHGLSMRYDKDMLSEKTQQMDDPNFEWDWNRGEVWCPFHGEYADWMPIKKDPPEDCPYMVEQAVSQC